MMAVKTHFALGIGICLALLTGCTGVHTQRGIPALSVEGERLSLFVEDNKLYLSGVLRGALPKQLKSVLSEYPNVTDLVLVDVPGSTDQLAVMEAARMLRYLEMNTHIAKTGYVLSGGVDLFLGGVQRTIGAGAGVGVHSWRDTQDWGDEIDLSDPVHASYVNFYLEMGVPERFYWFTLDAAPAERVYFLSPEEIYDYQLVTD
ncbi:alpha/beta hydrolase [Marinomonas ostreistagni]|uniref:Alpha/beta hydrolase n=1 Tax=Marinomonas ostreistagni TaxID=359209 RepID=A0ABS0Z5W2_9GAMM|nr:alpha/beta hydrolase [Marinomonas ostreistagni]MBJ7549059.1 alpha/beta hydrolase [Marinomonas ostreistagni]